MDDFWTRLDARFEQAKKSVVGEKMTEAYFHPAHTGGGCAVWELVFDGDGGSGNYLWVCDEGNDLGDSLDHPYLVGFYNKDGDILGQDTVPNLQAAIEWCEARSIANKWVSRFGMGFHPDTRGKDYTPRLNADDAKTYDSDMDRLFEIAPDPYQAGLEAMGNP